MTEEKNVASSCWPKKSKLLEDVRNSSNLRRSSHWLIHQFDLFNTIDDPIKIEEMEDPYESRENELAFGEEASSEEDFRDISNAAGETEMAEDSLDESATAVGEDRYKHTSQSTPSLVCSSPLSFLISYPEECFLCSFGSVAISLLICAQKVLF